MMDDDFFFNSTSSRVKILPARSEGLVYLSHDTCVWRKEIDLFNDATVYCVCRENSTVLLFPEDREWYYPTKNCSSPMKGGIV